MSPSRFASKPVLPVIAAAFAVLALLTSEIKEQAHIPLPAAADALPQEQMPGAAHLQPAVAEIHFRHLARIGRDEFIVAADITARADLDQAELVLVPEQGLELVGTSPGERITLAAGDKITRAYRLIRHRPGGSGLTLRVRGASGTAEQSVVLPPDGAKIR